MAEAGVGVHLLEIERMERVLHKTPSFASRVFTAEEQRYCARALRPAARYAGCLAARGAVRKALGLDAARGLGRWDVTLAFEADGTPQVVLAGAALAAAASGDVDEVALSLSYTENVAVANALALTKATRPQPKPDHADERARIARSFREVRSVLDELERVQEDDSMSEGGVPLAEKGVSPDAGDVPSAAEVVSPTAAEMESDACLGQRAHVPAAGHGAPPAGSDVKSEAGVALAAEQEVERETGTEH